MDEDSSPYDRSDDEDLELGQAADSPDMQGRRCSADVRRRADRVVPAKDWSYVCFVPRIPPRRDPTERGANQGDRQET